MIYARADGDSWLVEWTAFNRYLPEVAIRRGDVEVLPLANAHQVEEVVRASVYRADPVMWAWIDGWCVGDWPAIRELSRAGD